MQAKAVIDQIVESADLSDVGRVYFRVRSRLRQLQQRNPMADMRWAINSLAKSEGWSDNYSLKRELAWYHNHQSERRQLIRGMARNRR